MTYEKRQQSYLLGRYAAKAAIHVLEPSFAMRDILISHGVFQQPIANHHLAHQIYISISHRKELATAVAFEEAHPMGAIRNLFRSKRS
ncbi:hypothetical protein [Paenibacillus bouchesdurhonensis]|uniref:hypothetical protein n=1 Tax=Paenibacillus bouchesdurhonensis TaxID=1870990 RepID=UPI0019026182|nr:hypothetical protein [Paenibacillus bouchesdurhonensis]